MTAHLKQALELISLTSILIVDDHAIVRRGIRQILKEDIRDVFFADARSGEECVSKAAKRAWDLIILDVSLPDRDGFAVLREITERRPQTRVLMLSVHAEPHYSMEASEMGAFGYLCKDAPLDSLLKAVRTVLAGRKHFGGKGLAHRQSGADLELPLRATLSVREREVMLALAGGRSVSEVAAALRLSVKTVSTFKRRVFNKLRLNSVANLVRYVIENKL